MQVGTQAQLVCKVTGRRFHPTEGGDGRVYCSECRQVILESGEESAASPAPVVGDADSSLAK